MAARGGPEGLRAQIALADPASSNIAVAAALGVSAQTVGTWRDRYARYGSAGLVDAAGRGHRRDPALADRVVSATITRDPADDLGHAGPSRWTARTLGAQLGVHERTVARVWADAELSPRRSGVLVPGVDPVHHGRRRGIAAIHLAADAAALVIRLSPGRLTEWPKQPGDGEVLAGVWEQAGEVVRAVQLVPHTPGPGRPGVPSLAEFLHDACVPMSEGTWWVLIDRPLVDVAAETKLRLSSTLPAVSVRFAPSRASWLLLVRRILAATAWEHARRGGDRGALREMAGSLLAQAHRPAELTASGQISWMAEPSRIQSDLEVLDRRRPLRRAPAVTEVVDGTAAWTRLHWRWHAHADIDLPHRALSAVQYLRRRADTIAVTAQDALDAVVVVHAARAHLDAVERGLFRAVRQSFVAPQDLVDVLGLHDADSVRKRIAHVLDTAHPQRRDRRTSPAVREYAPTGVEAPPALGPDAEPALSEITRYGAAEVGAFLHHRWSRRHGEDGDGTTEVPGPQEYEDLVDYLVARHRPGGPSMRLDERVGELRAGIWLLAFLRGQVPTELQHWTQLARSKGVPWEQLAAAAGRTPKAAAAHHRAWLGSTAGLAPAQESAGTGHVVEPDLGRGVESVLLPLLAAEHRAVMKHDEDLRATLAAIDEALQFAEEDGRSTALRGWLSVLLTELRLSEIDVSAGALAPAYAAAQRWLTNDRAGLPPDRPVEDG
jgi:transposase